LYFSFPKNVNPREDKNDWYFMDDFSDFFDELKKVFFWLMDCFGESTD